MTDYGQDDAREARDRGRSEEAHWEVAEAGAEREVDERPSEGQRESETDEHAWEEEGGAQRRER